MFSVGQQVRRKRDGVRGIVTEVNEREVVVKYDATNRTETTPWGVWTDTKGEEGHHFLAFAPRVIERDPA
jgi:hypothetical protein